MFDAWIKPGPGDKKEIDVASREQAARRSPATSGNSLDTPGQVTERSVAAPGVRISGDAETKEYAVKKEEGHKGFQPVPKKKAATKKFMAAYSKGQEEKCCNEDHGYWSGFARRVPNWP